MNSSDIESILLLHASGEISLGEAAERIEEFWSRKEGGGPIPRDAADQQSLPGVIFCEGKTPEEIAEEFETLLASSSNILLIKTDALVFGRIRNIYTDAEWHESARLIRVLRDRSERGSGEIAIVAATADDIPIAEVAALTAETMGNMVRRIWNGNTILPNERKLLERSRVIVFAAENEHAVDSLIGDKLDMPVILVPTNVRGGEDSGDGAELSGMLSSSLSNLTAVNVGNGFGAGLVASLINKAGNK